MARALIGVWASLHNFGAYGGVGMQRPLLAAGALVAAAEDYRDQLRGRRLSVS